MAVGASLGTPFFVPVVFPDHFSELDPKRLANDCSHGAADASAILWADVAAVSAAVFLADESPDVAADCSADGPPVVRANASALVAAVAVSFTRPNEYPIVAALVAALLSSFTHPDENSIVGANPCAEHQTDPSSIRPNHDPEYSELELSRTQRE